MLAVGACVRRAVIFSVRVGCGEAYIDFFRKLHPPLPPGGATALNFLLPKRNDAILLESADERRVRRGFSGRLRILSHACPMGMGAGRGSLVVHFPASGVIRTWNISDPQTSLKAVYSGHSSGGAK